MHQYATLVANTNEQKYIFVSWKQRGDKRYYLAPLKNIIYTLGRRCAQFELNACISWMGQTKQTYILRAWHNFLLQRQGVMRAADRLVRVVITELGTEWNECYTFDFTKIHGKNLSQYWLWSWIFWRSKFFFFLHCILLITKVKLLQATE